MRDNYDGSEYGRVTVGRGKAVHFGNPTDGITACGKRGYLSDASGHTVTCKVCVKMAETTHDGSRPLIKDEQPAAPAESEPTSAGPVHSGWSDAAYAAAYDTTPAEPTQTFEVTYLAPRTGTQRVETVEATTVHDVPVQPRDAEVLLSIYLISKESALLDLTAAAADAHVKSTLVRREELASLRARQMGATVNERYAATIAGIRQVDPNY